MVKVIIYNLLRSKYGINEIEVQPGTITSIMDEIVERHPNIIRSDFDTCVVFVKGQPLHLRKFDTIIEDNDEIIFTNFVGGG